MPKVTTFVVEGNVYEVTGTGSLIMTQNSFDGYKLIVPSYELADFIDWVSAEYDAFVEINSTKEGHEP